MSNIDCLRVDSMRLVFGGGGGSGFGDFVAEGEGFLGAF